MSNSAPDKPKTNNTGALLGSPKRALQHTIVFLGLSLAAIGLLYAHILDQGEMELKSAEALANAGEFDEAIVHARQSASWFVPGAPHVASAYARLADIASICEGRGDTKTALFAWHAVRTATISSRWAEITHERELAVADASIARLSSKQPVALGAADRDPEGIQRKLHEILSRNDRPRVPWIAALLGGFVCMIVGLVSTAWRGYSPGGKPVHLRQVPGLIIAAIGLLAWVLALWNA